MFDSLKGFLVGKLAGWLLKAVGGFMLGLGYTQSSTEEIITGVATFVVGLVVSLFQHHKAVNTPAPAQFTGRPAPPSIT